MDYISLSKLAYGDRTSYEQTYQERFNSPYAHHLDICIGDWPAFFVTTPEIFQFMLSIHKTDKQIRDLYQILPMVAIKQFSRRCLIDEIVLTNGIEGVHSTRREIDGVLAELGKNHRAKRFDGLIQKYVMLQKGEDIPLVTCWDLRKVYDDLTLREVVADDPKNMPDGRVFRKGPVDVTTPTQKVIHRGLYPEEKIIDTMSKALDYLGDSSVDLLYRICVFHYLLGYIHPFYDGNGRLNRFISSYMLGKELHPILGYRLSYTIKENIGEYYKAFKVCNQPKNRGDLTPFVEMFLKIIEESTQQLLKALMGRLNALDYYGKIVESLPGGTKKSYYTLYFVLIQAELFSEKGISTKELLDVIKVSSATLRKQLQEIEATGLLERSSHGHAKYYSLDLDKADQYQNR